MNLIGQNSAQLRFRRIERDVAACFQLFLADSARSLSSGRMTRVVAEHSGAATGRHFVADLGRAEAFPELRLPRRFRAAESTESERKAQNDSIRTLASVAIRLDMHHDEAAERFVARTRFHDC